MKQFISKALCLSMLSSSILFASEIEFGSGTFSMQGGFSGLSNTIDTDVTTYTLKEHHKNIASSNYFYSYSITWYDSNTLTQAQQELNNAITTANTAQTVITIPAVDYEFQGIDLNLIFGYDLYHKSENQYFGVGLLVGATFPWIDSKSSSSNTSDTTQDALEDSTTSMITFKVGPTLHGSFAFNDYFMAYYSGSIAYQYAKVKNDTLDSDFTTDGVFEEFDIGIKLQPFSYNYELTSWITLSPKLYFTLGYRYSNWDVNDVSLNLINSTYSAPSDTMSFNSSIGYFGIGYDLF